MNQPEQKNQNAAVSSSSYDEKKGYFDYLLRRSHLAWLYRKYWLYPKLCQYLSGRVLDVGCGIGDLLSMRRNTVGVDINPRAVEWCRQQGLDAQIMEPDSLPFDDAVFDGVVLDNVLEHLINPEPLLGEIHRVLRTGGAFVVGVPGIKGYASDPDHKVFYDSEALVAAISSAKFELVEILCAPLKSKWLDEHIPQYCMYGVFRRG